MGFFGFGASLPKILIADGDPGARALVAIFLEDKYAVTEVGDGVAAVEAAREDDFSLILLDYDMPGLNGLGVVELIRAIERLKHIPIVMITGRTQLEDVDRLLSAGANDYLTKPIDLRKLSAKVDKYIPAKNF